MDDNPYEAPKSEVRSLDGENMFRKGKSLVFNRDVDELPHLCVKCNAPTGGRSKKVRLSYLNPWFYLTILLNILITLICYLIFSKRHTVRIGLCEQHHKRHTIHLAVIWVIFLGSTFTLFAAIAAEQSLVMITSLTGYLVAIIWALAIRLGYARKITKDQVWLNGPRESFLAAYPELES